MIAEKYTWFPLVCRLCGYGRKTAKGDSKGGKPLAYWGIFSKSATKRKENALISYGFSSNSPSGLLRINPDSSYRQNITHCIQFIQ